MRNRCARRLGSFLHRRCRRGPRHRDGRWRCDGRRRDDGRRHFGRRCRVPAPPGRSRQLLRLRAPAPRPAAAPRPLPARSWSVACRRDPSCTNAAAADPSAAPALRQRRDRAPTEAPAREHQEHHQYDCARESVFSLNVQDGDPSDENQAPAVPDKTALRCSSAKKISIAQATRAPIRPQEKNRTPAPDRRAALARARKLAALCHASRPVRLRADHGRQTRRELRRLRAARPGSAHSDPLIYLRRRARADAPQHPCRAECRTPPACGRRRDARRRCCSALRAAGSLCATSRIHSHRPRERFGSAPAGATAVERIRA